MEIKTLKSIKEISGIKVGRVTENKDGTGDYVSSLCDECPIEIDDYENAISFNLNGCEVDAIIETSKIIIEETDAKIPSEWNLKAIQSLNNALECLRLKRKRYGETNKK